MTESQIFDVGGASVVRQAHLLDRHWRNIRTLTSHDPSSHKAQAIGAYHVRGTADLFVRDSRDDATFAGNEDETEFGLHNYLGIWAWPCTTQTARSSEPYACSTIRRATTPTNSAPSWRACVAKWRRSSGGTARP